MQKIWTGIAYIAFVLTGCKTVYHEDWVQYEDGNPVQFAKVYETGDNYVGVTITDTDGKWRLYGPSRIRVTLCIENPMDDYRYVCWDEVERKEFLRFPSLMEEPHLQRRQYVEEDVNGTGYDRGDVYDEWVRYRR